MKINLNRRSILSAAFLLFFATVAASYCPSALADEKAVKEFEQVSEQFKLRNIDPKELSEILGENDETTNDDASNSSSEANDDENVDVANSNESTDGESVDESDSARTTPKRFAIIFAQTHSYDYLTDVVKEDKLYPATYGSLTTCYAVMRESQYFDECVVLAGKRLIKENVDLLFKTLAKESKEGDEIFIYWNGHGATGLPDDADDEQDGVDEFLVLYESTNLLGSDWAKSFRDTSLVDDELGEYFRSLEGRKITAIFETCHSGGLATAPTNAERATTRGIVPRPGERILATSLKSFAAKSTAEVRENEATYKRALDRELDKIGSAYADSLPYGASGNAANDGRLNNRDRVRSSGDAGAFQRWFSSRFSEAKDLANETPRDIDSDGSYNLFFSSQESESSYAYAYVRDEDGEVARLAINPVLLAYALCLKKAKEANVPLRFGDFANVATEVLEKNIAILRELLNENESNVNQTPVIYVNLPDVLLYAPDKLN